MLHQIFLLIFLILVLPRPANAQETNSFAFRHIIESKFWVDLDTLDLCETTILNGIPFNKTEIDRELKKIEAGEILVTELVDLSSSPLIHQYCNYIILLGTGDNQQKREKQRILGAIRENLNIYVPKFRIHDYSCSECKQVIVDGRPTSIYEAQAIVNKLDVKDIKYIASYKSADPNVYGRNAENGLIEIYLTKKARRRLN